MVLRLEGMMVELLGNRLVLLTRTFELINNPNKFFCGMR